MTVKQWNKTFVILALLGLFLGAFLAGGRTDLSPDKQKEKAELLDRGIINILLIGVDTRSSELDSLSDTLILASIDTGVRKAALVSIPRDTRVKHGNGYAKINAFNVEGGPELARDKVEELLKVPIHYYAVANFSGFKDMVDVLGGVSIDVEERMYKPSEGINLRPGLQRLNGSQALAYCRWRGDALGDISRTERQQKFLRALAGEVMQPEHLTKLPQLVPVMRKYITTDIPASKLYQVAQMADDFKTMEITTQTLPGWFYTDPANGASYWAVDESQLRGMVARVLDGRTVAVIDENHPVLVAQRPPTQEETPAEPEASIADEDIPDNAVTLPDASGPDTAPPADDEVKPNTPVTDNPKPVIDSELVLPTDVAEPTPPPTEIGIPLDWDGVDEPAPI